MIEVQNLTKRYGDVTAIDDIGFAIPSGKICGFVGPNGAGKTTTLRVLATLERPTAGWAVVNGSCVQYETGGVRTDMGYMPDYVGAYPNMTALDFLDFFARAYRLFGRARTQRLDDIIEFLDIGPLLSRPVDSMSKGQKQRLSLARSLMPDPKVLILDEPAAGLDPRARLELYGLLSLLGEGGTTIFVSSHILRELAALVNWLVIIKDGHIRYCGAMHDLDAGPSGFGLEVGFGSIAVRRFLMEQPAVHNVSGGDDGHVNFQIDESVERVESLLQRIVAKEFRVRQLYRRERTLEDIFLELTAAPAERPRHPAEEQRRSA